ncbi:MAG: hypothetical protein IT372_34185 [Polyangiaceae bacterium]|nr:hypothetical protein [Polyangiaceae bacterium]
MTGEGLRWLSGAHGVIAWAAALACAAAVGAGWWGRAARGRGALAATAAGLASAAFASGLPLDMPYRGRLRQQVFIDSEALGWLFERKLHFAFGGLALAWCAVALFAASTLASRRASGQRHGAADMARGASAALAASAALTLFAAIAGAIVAHGHRF